MLKSLYSRHNDVFLAMLRSRRESLQLRQRDLARRLGRGQAIVSRVEAGSRRLDVIELWSWLRALEVDFVEFIGELKVRLESHAALDATLVTGRVGSPPDSLRDGAVNSYACQETAQRNSGDT